MLHASSLSQVIISEMLSRWDIEGLERHIQEVEDFYRARRDAMHAAASRHLTGLCEWSLPRGGMFLWIKVHAHSSPMSNTYHYCFMNF